MADSRVTTIASGLRLFRAGAIDAESFARALVSVIDATVECGTVVASGTRPSTSTPANSDLPPVKQKEA